LIDVIFLPFVKIRVSKSSPTHLVVSSLARNPLTLSCRAQAEASLTSFGRASPGGAPSLDSSGRQIRSVMASSVELQKKNPAVVFLLLYFIF